MYYRMLSAFALLGVMITFQPAQASDSSEMPWLSADNCLNASTELDNPECWVNRGPLYYGTAEYDAVTDTTTLTSDGDVDDYGYQDLSLRSVEGRYLLLISFTQAEETGTTITGLPYLYGYQMTEDDHIEEYLQGQSTRFDGAAGQWDVSYGLYLVDSSLVTQLRFFFNQASYSGDTYNNSAALFRHAGVFIVDSQLEADELIATYQSSLNTEITLGTVRNDPWNKTITLNWTNPTDSDFDHVEIMRTNRDGNVAIIATNEEGESYIDDSIAYGMTYTYTLSTVDTDGNVSTGVTTDSRKVRSPHVHHLRLTARDTSMVARWERLPLRLNPAVGYLVYYGTSADALTNVIDVGNSRMVTIQELVRGQVYYVAVAAYNGEGVAGPLSSIKSIRL